MANVDKCVRLCQKGVCSDTSYYSNEISKLKDNLRVNILKGKSNDQIQILLSSWSEYITKIIKDKYYSKDKVIIKLLPSSDNNKKAADIFHILPNQERVDIELKFGAATDKQIGMKNFDKIFNNSFFSVEFSNDIRKHMFCEFINENYDETKQSLRLIDTLNRIIKNFNKFVSNSKFQLNKNSQKELEDLLFENSGELSSSSKEYMRFELNGDNFELIKPLTKGEGMWEIEEVALLKEQRDRVNVKLYNFKSNLKIKFTLNWKNKYKFNGLKYKARLGFGSPSWNIWITKL